MAPENPHTQPIRCINDPRRVLRAKQAAWHCGISKTTFDTWIKKGRLPAGTKIDNCVLWDIKALDFALDEIFYGQAVDKTPLIRALKL